MKGASSTARLIAASIVLQDEHEIAAKWVPASTIALSRSMLKSGGPFARLILSALRARWVFRLIGAIEDRLLPGIQAHYLLRKHRIAGWMEESVSSGVTQVVVLGAGLDGLATDVCLRHPHVRVVEIDYATTQAIKRRALDDVGFTRVPALFAFDLARAGLGTHLEKLGLARSAPTLVVAEGLLMYLPMRSAWRLLDSLTGYFSGGIDLIFSTMENDSTGHAGFASAHPVIRRWLEWRGEPFRWACDEVLVKQVIEHAGLRSCEIDRGDEPPRPEFSGWSPCTGETLYRARRDERDRDHGFISTSHAC